MRSNIAIAGEKYISCLEKKNSKAQALRQLFKKASSSVLLGLKLEAKPRDLYLIKHLLRVF